LGERRWAGGRRDRNSLEAGGLTSSRHGDPPWRAQAALAARNDELLAELSAAIGLATAARLPRTDRQWALDRLAGFCSRRAPAYLAACDRAVYTLAAEAADTRLLVHALRVQRELIAAHVAELGSATEPTKIATAAHTVLAMLAACGEVERAVLWPALARLPGLDLAGAVAEFDALLRHCIPVELDVRKIPHGKRHSRILDICTRLAPGHSFVFIDNPDHPPAAARDQGQLPGPVRLALPGERTLPVASAHHQGPGRARGRLSSAGPSGRVRTVTALRQACG
jgi:hypothetical protein